MGNTVWFWRHAGSSTFCCHCLMDSHETLGHIHLEMEEILDVFGLDIDPLGTQPVLQPTVGHSHASVIHWLRWYTTPAPSPSCFLCSCDSSIVVSWCSRKSYSMPLFPHRKYIFTPHGCGLPSSGRRSHLMKN